MAVIVAINLLAWAAVACAAAFQSELADTQAGTGRPEENGRATA